MLKGVDPEWLKQWVLDNKSIHVMNKEHKIITSAIVGGTLSSALGAALAIKREGKTNRVWCFCGDMTASTGQFHDIWQYAYYNDLPMTFVIEDNGLSTDTPTRKVWGLDDEDPFYYQFLDELDDSEAQIIYYKYTRTYPHYGVGVFVDFKDIGI